MRACDDNDFSLILLPLCNTLLLILILSHSLPLSHTHTLSLPFSLSTFLSHSPLQGGKKELMKEAQVRREALAVRANVGIREVSVTALSSLYCFISSLLYSSSHRCVYCPFAFFLFPSFSCISHLVRSSCTYFPYINYCCCNIFNFNFNFPFNLKSGRSFYH